MLKKEITIALVGYGYWGPNLLRNYVECPNCRVKYVCDKSDSQLKKVTARYPAIIATDDYSTILSDSDVDAVVIATPISTHFWLASKAIMAGKHVFVEKPLAASAWEAQELVNLSESKKVVLMVGHTFIYSPPVIKTKELIDSGELGKIYYISSSRVNLGLHQKDASVIWDLAPHDFSIIFEWLGEEPCDMSAFGRGCIRSHIHDVAFINLKFPSGAIAEVQLSWLSPVKLRRTVVVGSKKMLVYDDTENTEKVKVFDHGVNYSDPKTFGEYQLSYRTGDVMSPQLDNFEPLFKEANHFLDCVATGNIPKSDGRKGLQVVKALEIASMCLLEDESYSPAGTLSSINNAPILSGEEKFPTYITNQLQR